MNSSEIRDFVLPSAPARTLWFEFLFVDGLLETHLSSENCDPTASELIISFLSNATTSPSSDSSNSNDNRRGLILKILAIKVASFFHWKTDFIDKLPLPMQQTLFETFKNICSSDSSCPPLVSAFAEISYQRWVIRSLTKSNYPTKSQKGLQMPLNLVQQVDPTFTPNEVIQHITTNLNWGVYLHVIPGLKAKLAPDGILSKEKCLHVPNSYCFKTDLKGTHNWSAVEEISCSTLASIVNYELGCYYFIREHPSYVDAFTHFDAIPECESHNLKNFEGYHAASLGLSSSEEVVLDDEPDEVSLKKSLDRMFSFQTCDLSFLETSKLKPDIVAHELSRYKSEPMTGQKSHLLRAVMHYLCNKIPGLSDEIFTDQEDEEMQTESTVATPDTLADDLLKILSKKEVRRPDEIIVDSTDPVEISSCDLDIPWNQINCNWSIPRLIEKAISEIPEVDLPLREKNKSLAVIAKANELRSRGFYSESRDLFLSVMEDRQAKAPGLAELIPFEVLRTDLECHERSKDVDERVVKELLERCINTVHDQPKRYTIHQREILLQEYSVAIEKAATFLLDHQSISLRNLTDHSNRAVRLAALLSTDSRAMSIKVCKDIWECLRSWLQSNHTSFIQFVGRINSKHIRSILASALVKMYNLVRDTSVLELTTPLLPSQSVLHWPSSLQSNQLMPPLDTVASVLDHILGTLIETINDDGIWVRCSAELALCQGDALKNTGEKYEKLYEKSMTLFLDLLSSTTQYFTNFTGSKDEDHILQRLIAASTKLSCHTQAAVLQQMLSEPNYSLAFKSLSERSCFDSCDDLIECIWDVSLLEYLVTLYSKRGDMERKSKAVQLIGQLELNANNSKETLNAAAGVRQRRFFRILTKKYA